MGKSMVYYPIFLKLRGKECVVIGGGEVAERKVRSLVEAGAQVKVLSPDLCPGLKSMTLTGTIQTVERPFRGGDLDGAFLVIAATDDPGTNREVAAEAERKGILINVVDQPKLCNFIVPSVARQGDLVIAISTTGRSPALAKKIRQELERDFLPSYALLLQTVSRVRQELRQKGIQVASQRWQEAFDPGLLDLVREGKGDVVRRRLVEQLAGDSPGKADV